MERASFGREDLSETVFDELHRLATAHMQREAPGHTLQPTALVNEAFLKLGQSRVWNNREHYLATAATAMRRILINHAHTRRSEKRGGGARRVTLFEAESPFAEQCEDLIALDSALEKLQRLDPTKSRIVELRFFGGLEVAETADVLGISTRTVERGWRFAKAWIGKEITGGR